MACMIVLPHMGHRSHTLQREVVHVLSICNTTCCTLHSPVSASSRDTVPLPPDALHSCVRQQHLRTDQSVARCVRQIHLQRTPEIHAHEKVIHSNPSAAGPGHDWFVEQLYHRLQGAKLASPALAAATDHESGRTRSACDAEKSLS